MTDVRKASPWRRFIAVLAALVLVVLGIPTHDAPARAEENDAIKFDPVTLRLIHRGVLISPNYRFASSGA